MGCKTSTNCLALWPTRKQTNVLKLTLSTNRDDWDADFSMTEIPRSVEFECVLVITLQAGVLF